MSNSSASKLSATSSPESRSPKSSRTYRGLILMGTIYAIWLAWLLYVGLVNYQSGNQ